MIELRESSGCSSRILGPGRGASQVCPNWRVVWQLSSMTLGMGVFTIPSVFVRLGLVQATLTTIVLGCFANFAMQGLLDLAVKHGTTESYEATAKHAFGRFGSVAMITVNVVGPSIASLSYLNAAAQLLEDVIVGYFFDFDTHSFPHDITVLDDGKSAGLLAAMVVAVLPTCLSPTLGKNVWVSELGIFSVGSAACFLLVQCAMIMSDGCQNVQCGTPPAMFNASFLDSLETTAILAFSFTSIFGVFPILQERVGTESMSNAVETMKVAIRYSVALCVALYVVIGLAGATTFGSVVKTIALRNVPLSSRLTQAVTLLLGVSVELLVAIVSFPAIHTLASLCPSGGSDRERMCIVIVFGFMMIVIDSILPTRICFTLAGGLGVSMGAYIMPSLIFFGLGGGSRWSNVAGASVLLLGLALLLGATPLALSRLPNAAGPAHVSLHDAVCNGGSALSPLV